MPFLGLVDIAGIQRFLFRAPELRMIAASSEHIEEMTQPGQLFARAAEDAKATMLFAAGGNAAFIAESAEQLKAVFRAISCSLLTEGNGLEVVVSLVEYERDHLARDYEKAVWELERRKLTQPRSLEFRLSGLEQPANSIDTNRPPKRYNGLIEPLNFADLICASTEKTDLMAVVSVDGLGMGKRLKAWMDRMKERNVSDAEFIAEFGSWSKAIKQHWAQSWKQTNVEIAQQFALGKLEHLYMETDDGHKRSIALQKGCYLPCRRIYQGGDDLSFVCDARLALAMTTVLVAYLERAQENMPEEFQALTVSVGIVFVDSHFPFARAVSLADDVRASAKRRAEELKKMQDLPSPPSTFDWWINRQGDMARPDPLFEGASLKPYVINAKDAPVSSVSWETLQTVILPGLWKTFGGSRNKMKDLLAAIEEGEQGAGVLRLLKLRPLDSMKRDGEKPFAFMGAAYNPETGFMKSGKGTPLLDAGELFDIHFPFSTGPIAEGA